MPSVEMEIKAADKRIGGLERAMDSLTKEFRQTNTTALEKRLDSVEKRITTIETIVKSMAAASKAGGGAEDSAAIKKLIAEAEMNIRRERQSTDKDANDNVKKLQKEAELLTLTLKTTSAKHEKHAADEKARIDKQIADHVTANLALAKQMNEQGKQLAATAKLESRLAVLEAVSLKRN